MGHVDTNLRIVNIIYRTFVRMGTAIQIPITQATDAPTVQILDHYVESHVITAQTLSPLQVQHQHQQLS